MKILFVHFILYDTETILCIWKQKSNDNNNKFLVILKLIHLNLNIIILNDYPKGIINIWRHIMNEIRHYFFIFTVLRGQMGIFDTIYFIYALFIIYSLSHKDDYENAYLSYFITIGNYYWLIMHHTTTILFVIKENFAKWEIICI